MLFPFLVASLGCFQAILASPAPLLKRCTNSADDRSCWGNYDISTNYYDEGPDTGVIREFWWEVTNTTAAPDGIERIVLSVNGTVPGPTIYADWGDTIVVHVSNAMANNGTSIHFHGIRQNYTNLMDGVPSVTQCPIAPGDSFTYTWKANQYGTSWWHSHFYVQAWDGVFGAMHINGPATADYDEDLGTLTLSDWSHASADQDVLFAGLHGPPKLPTGLLNGTNTYNNSGTIVGSRFEKTITSNTRYRLRLINTAADTHFKFSIDDHALKVIASDFVPIVPYTTNYVSMAMGQRYDVIFTSDQMATNYWIRAIAQNACSNNANPTDIKGIIRYDSNSTEEPTSSAFDDAALQEDCADELSTSLVPHVAIAASDSADETDEFAVAITPGQNGAALWEMGTHSFVSQWNYPTVLQAYEGNSTWSAEQEVYQFPNANVWVYWIIQTSLGVAHPLHLHGHDFWVLGNGTGTYDASTAGLKFINRPRRDVVLLPGSGWVAIAFKTDNPGAWLMHCHIAWHTSEGLAVQVLERESEMVALMDESIVKNTCDAWNTYTAKDMVIQDDSGI